MLILLDLLATRRSGMTLHGLADELDVTERQVRRDLEAVERAGYALAPTFIDSRAAVRLGDPARPAHILARRRLVNGEHEHLEILRVAMTASRLVRYRLRGGLEGVLAPLALVETPLALHVLAHPMSGEQARQKRLPDGRGQFMPLDHFAQVEPLPRSRFIPPRML